MCVRSPPFPVCGKIVKLRRCGGVQTMNDHRPYFRDMGALGYTFYDEVEQRYFRGMLFGYTRVVVGAALETYEHVWKGDMALFDKAPYPPPPAYIFEERAKFKQAYIEAAVAVFKQPYPPPMAATLAELERYVVASGCSLDHKSALIGAAVFSPVVKAWGDRIRMVLCVMFCTTSSPTLNMGCVFQLGPPVECSRARFMLTLIEVYEDARANKASRIWADFQGFVPEARRGCRNGLDRTQATHGRQQDLLNKVGDSEVAAEQLLTRLDALVDTLVEAMRVNPPRERLQAALGAFATGVKEIKIGIQALQLSNLVVNLYCFGYFDGLPDGAIDELLTGEWPGLGDGTEKSLRMAGFQNSQDLRAAVLAKGSISAQEYADVIYVT
jgi:hypothetical protein